MKWNFIVCDKFLGLKLKNVSMKRAKSIFVIC